MSKLLISKSTLQNIANAIRAKEGKANNDEKILVSDLASRVEGLSTLGADTQDATATENDIKAGKTVYARGAKVTGTLAASNMTAYNNNTIPFGQSLQIAPGYVDSTVTYTAANPTGNVELSKQTGTDVKNYATASVTSGSAHINNASITNIVSGDSPTLNEDGQYSFHISSDQVPVMSSVTKAGWIKAGDITWGSAAVNADLVLPAATVNATATVDVTKSTTVVVDNNNNINNTVIKNGQQTNVVTENATTTKPSKGFYVAVDATTQQFSEPVLINANSNITVTNNTQGWMANNFSTSLANTATASGTVTVNVPSINSNTTYIPIQKGEAVGNHSTVYNIQIQPNRSNTNALNVSFDLTGPAPSIIQEGYIKQDEVSDNETHQHESEQIELTNIQIATLLKYFIDRNEYIIYEKTGDDTVPYKPSYSSRPDAWNVIIQGGALTVTYRYYSDFDADIMTKYGNFLRYKKNDIVYDIEVGTNDDGTSEWSTPQNILEVDGVTISVKEISSPPATPIKFRVYMHNPNAGLLGEFTYDPNPPQ